MSSRVPFDFWTEIVENVYIAGMFEWPRNFKGLLVCVLEQKPLEEPANATWVPILENGRASLKQLDIIADIIDTHMPHGPVVIHCGAGIERSPLAVAWFLYKKRGVSLNDAYALIRAKRPSVQDRQAWLPASVNYGYPDPNDDS